MFRKHMDNSVYVIHIVIHMFFYTTCVSIGSYSYVLCDVILFKSLSHKLADFKLRHKKMKQRLINLHNYTSFICINTPTSVSESAIPCTAIIFEY